MDRIDEAVFAVMVLIGPALIVALCSMGWVH